MTKEKSDSVKSASLDIFKNVLTAVIVAAILALPFRGAIDYIGERFSLQAQVPIGTIVAWNGTGTLPDGWAMCDGRKNEVTGTNTPNLQDRFLRGVKAPGDAQQLDGEPIVAGGDTVQGMSGPGAAGIVDLKKADHGKTVNIPLNYSVVFIIRIK